MREIDNYLIGLNWVETTTKNFQKEFIKQSKENSYKYSFVVKYKDHIAIGIGDVKENQRSATAHFAEANAFEINKTDYEDNFPAWVYVKKISETKADQDAEYWISAVYKGLPFVGSDRIVPENVLQLELESIVNSLKEQTANVTIFTTNYELTQILSAFSEVVHKSLDDIVDHVKYTTKIKKNSSTNPLLVYTLLAAIMAGVAVWGYIKYEEYLEEQEAVIVAENDVSAQERAERQRIENNLKKYEKEKQELVQDLIEKAKVELNQELTYPKFVDLLHSWNETVLNVKTDTTQWNKVNMQCILKENTPYCVLNFKRDKGTIKTLLKEYPSVTVNFDKDKGDTASMEYFGSNISKKEGDYTKLPELDEFNFKTITKLQELEINKILKDIQPSEEIISDISLPKPPEGIKQAKPPVIKLGAAKGEFMIVGEGLLKLKSLEKDLQDQDLKLNRLFVEFGSFGNTKWLLQGMYYIKNNSNINTLEIPKAEIINKFKE